MVPEVYMEITGSNNVISGSIPAGTFFLKVISTET
jgi:hypothetical protein